MVIAPFWSQDILEFIKQAQERVLSHQEDQALLKAYIALKTTTTIVRGKPQTKF